MKGASSRLQVPPFHHFDQGTKEKKKKKKGLMCNRGIMIVTSWLPNADGNKLEK